MMPRLLQCVRLYSTFCATLCATLCATFGALLGAQAAAAESPASLMDPPQAVSIPAARQIDVSANGSGYRYRIFVATPPGPVPAAGYPVLYVLDGNAAFPVAALLARIQASRSKVTGHVAPLVVGIGYPGQADFDVKARQRDYTVAVPGKPLDDAGGADAFLDFIERQLRPMIAARYRVDPSRQALFGHSYGGLLVVHALLTRPTMFSTYLASSPSIWWGARQVLADLPRLDRVAAEHAPRVQISVGSKEDDRPQGKVAPDMLALAASRQMLPAARELAAHLRALPGWSARLAFYELAGEDHGAVWLPAMSRGMDFFMEQAESPR